MTAAKGVNLGGWLVLEPWITPSLFAGTGAVDEFSFCHQADRTRLARLRQFREQFITLEDFRWLAGQGVEIVRIPVGYWVFGGEQPYMPTVEYLDKAFAWAEATGVQVLISLHGVPGSQNGKMHSGKQGAAEWPHDPAHVAKALEVVRKLAVRYQSSPALWGISVLNEPSRLIAKRFVKRYYRKAYRLIRSICGDATRVVISDGLQAWRWLWVLGWPRYKAVVLDVHYYRAFKQKHIAMPAARHLQQMRGRVRRRMVWLSRLRPYIVGEWSVALDAASIDGLSESDTLAVYRDFYDVQLAAYNRSVGQFYWTYKTEDQGPWSYRDFIHKRVVIKN